ncbi:hypothetical protein ACFLSF_01175 [Candidatus Bipolaricaulota bacterium]
MFTKRTLSGIGLAALTLLALLLTASFSLPGPGQEWEYLVVSPGKVRFADSPEYACRAAQSTMAVLDDIGADGWELVTVVGQIGGDQEFIFKRPVP